MNNNVSPLNKRSQGDNRAVTFITTLVMLAVLSPVMAVVLGLSVRLYRVVAG